jgi:hypothetical protein
VHYKKHVYPSRAHNFTPGFDGVRVAHLFSILCRIYIEPVRYDFSYYLSDIEPVRYDISHYLPDI